MTDQLKNPAQSSLWLKSRKAMRREFEPDSRRQNEAVLPEIRASFDNEEAGSKTQAAAARLLPQAASMSLGMGWGILLTGVIWTLLILTLLINALHAPLAHRTANMESIIWGLGIAMILAGGAGMAVGVNRIMGRGNWMWAIPAWFIIVALCIWLGAWWDARLSGNWPWIQAIIGSAFLAVVIATVAFLRKRKGA
jgi:hypothetical protein